MDGSRSEDGGVSSVVSPRKEFGASKSCLRRSRVWEEDGGV
jgi:hypothetical protein